MGFLLVLLTASVLCLNFMVGSTLCNCLLQYTHVLCITGRKKDIQSYYTGVIVTKMLNTYKRETRYLICFYSVVSVFCIFYSSTNWITMELHKAFSIGWGGEFWRLRDRGIKLQNILWKIIYLTWNSVLFSQTDFNEFSQKFSIQFKMKIPCMKNYCVIIHLLFVVVENLSENVTDTMEDVHLINGKIFTIVTKIFTIINRIKVIHFGVSGMICDLWDIL